MPKGLDYDKIVAEALRRLGQSGTIDNVKNIGGNLADDISKILSEATGKTPKPVKPPKPPKAPKAPKNPKAPPKDVGRAVNAEEEFVAGMQPTTAEVWKNGPALDRYASKNGPDTLDAEEYAILKLYNQFIKAGKTPPTPRVPKNPPKSGRGKQSEPPLSKEQLAAAKLDEKYLRSEGKKLAREERVYGTDNMDLNDKAILEIYKFNQAKANKAPKNPPKSGRGENPPAAGAVAPAPKGPKPKGPKSGTADKAERDAQKEIIRQQNRDNWAKERAAYNEMKAVEREQRKADNRAAWAKQREEEYGGNITEAVKGTSRGRNRNKKKDAK
jgi:hypothetical protein